MSSIFRSSVIPNSRLYLILIGILINSIIFSASFTFFTSFNEFSNNFLGEDEETFVIYNPLANTVFTGTVPTYLSDLIQDIPGVECSPEVLVAGITGDEVITLRGVGEDFYNIQNQELEAVTDRPFMAECLVGYHAYQRLGKEKGERLTIRSTTSETILDFEIIGVYSTDSPLDYEIIIPIEYARLLNGLPLERSTLIRVKLDQEILDRETLSKMITETHNLSVNVNSESSFNSRLQVKTETGKVVQSIQFTSPDVLNFSLPFGRYFVWVEGIVEEVILDRDQFLAVDVSESQNRLAFNVLDASSGEPLEAEIRIEGIQIEFTSTYLVPGSGNLDVFLRSGEYQIEVTGNGYTLVKTVQVSEDLELHFYLGTIPLKLEVFNEQLQPLSNISITVNSIKGSQIQYTDDSGLAVFLLEEGEYEIIVEEETNYQSLIYFHEREQTLIFTLSEESDLYRLEIQVAWSNGTLVQDAYVSLESGDLRWNGYTGRNGRIVVENLPPSLISIYVEKSGLNIDREISLERDTYIEIEIPASIKLDVLKLSPEWIRYLPESVTLTLSDVMLQNAMRILVSLMTSTLFILAILFTIATTITSIDIIQNAVNESSQNLGIIRSIGATKNDSTRIYGISLILYSTLFGFIGYLAGYLLLSIAANMGLLSLAGYVLEPKISIMILGMSIILCPIIALIGLYRQLGSLFQYSPMSLLKGLRKSDIIYLPRNIRFPLLAFLIPLIVRAVPEILVAPYNIGYDTVSAYIPSLVALQTGFENQVYDFLFQRPFFWVIASLPYPFDNLAPFKFLPVILHGLLGFSIFIYAKTTTSDDYKSLAISLLSTIYFISLRISWDLYGNEMGLILVFLSLTLLARGVYSWINRGLLIIVVAAAVLTHEAASMLLFLSSIPSIIQAIREKKPRYTVNLLFLLVPLFLFFVYRLQILNFPLIADPTSFRYPSQTYESLFKSVSTLYIYSVLPLLPFAIVGLNSTKRSMPMIYWYIGATVAALSPLLSPDAGVAFWDRWVYMTAYPLCFYGVEGVYLLRRVKIKYNISKPGATDLGKVSGVLLAIIVLLVSGSFLVSTPGQYQPYHTLYGAQSLWIVRFVPSSMLLSTVPVFLAEEAQTSIEWLNENVSDVSVLLVDEEFRGYAALYADKDKFLLRDLGVPWYSNPSYIMDASKAAEDMSKLGYDVYLLSRQFNFEGCNVVLENNYLRISKYEK